MIYFLENDVAGHRQKDNAIMGNSGKNKDTLLYSSVMLPQYMLDIIHGEENEKNKPRKTKSKIKEIEHEKELVFDGLLNASPIRQIENTSKKQWRYYENLYSIFTDDKYMIRRCCKAHIFWIGMLHFQPPENESLVFYRLYCKQIKRRNTKLFYKFKEKYRAIKEIVNIDKSICQIVLKDFKLKFEEKK